MIELRQVSKRFRTGKREVCAVRDVNLSIGDGEIFGIIGFSGAGKSTLVRCINLLERPTEGSVVVNGTDLTTLGSAALRAARKDIGMIFQQFNLLSQRTVRANVRFPLELAGVKGAEASRRVDELLELVGLTAKADSYPSQLSGGQKQRVAIARALATNPRILLCDEATSALDPRTTRSILSLLKDLNRQLGVTVVVITHEMKVVEQICDRVAVMDAGSIVEVGPVHEVFLRPQSETARRLIEPSERPFTPEHPERVLRLAFTGDESGAPVISDLTASCGVMVSILSANTENIGGRLFGQMLIEMPTEPAAQDAVRSYLNGRGICFEEGASLFAAAEPASEEDARPSDEIVEGDIPHAGMEALGREVE